MRYQEAPLYARAYGVARYVIERAQRFPKHQRFILGARVQSAALDLVDAVVLALLRREDRHVRMDEADASIARLTISLRLSRDLGLLSAGSVTHALTEIREIGRMLGGWRKAGRTSLSHADPTR